MNILDYAWNYCEAEVDEHGFWRFHRFTKQQMRQLAANQLAFPLAQCSSGVRLSLFTTGDEVRLQCKRDGLIRRLAPALPQIGVGAIREARAKSSKLDFDELDGFGLAINRTPLSTHRVRNGEIVFAFDNPLQSTVRVDIYFPCLFPVMVSKIESNGIMHPCPPEDAILCLGDSITQGLLAGNPCASYVALLQHYFGICAINQGLSACCFDVSALAELPLNLKCITVAYGTNDWAQENTLANIRTNVQQYFARLNQLFPNLPIIAITPIWRKDMLLPLNPTCTLAEVAECIREIAAAYDNVAVLEGMELVPHSEDYFADGYLHPNAAGFACYAQGLQQYLLAADILLPL